MMIPKNIYYQIKPVIPRRLQIAARRLVVAHLRSYYADIWPIDPIACQTPTDWRGWPDNKQFALVLTHDVDTEKGHQKCAELVNLEMSLGFHSSFNFVPERYNVCPQLRANLKNKGFEVGVHGLNHDGKLYKSKQVFINRAVKINRYLKEWGAVGFRSPAMHHNLEWLGELDIEYDASTFDTDPFEPQSDAVSTIFPFWVEQNSGSKGYVEIPYTLPQDSTLFILMKEKTIDIWKQKLDWIAEHGGMVLLNTHPDYMSFNGKKAAVEEYPASYYTDFLSYVTLKYSGKYWHVLPKDLTRFWIKKNSLR